MTDHEIAQQLNALDWRTEIKKDVNVGEWLSIFFFEIPKKWEFRKLKLNCSIFNLSQFSSFVNDWVDDTEATWKIS